MPFDPAAVSLDGKVAVVTGAAQGIGAATASTLARFGADLAICDRNADGMARTATDVETVGRRCVTGVLDVRDGEAVRAWLGTVEREYGRVDVLVNNAGGGFYAPFEKVSEKGQRSLVDENFTSVTHFVRGCSGLRAAGGSIVNITSIEAFRAAPGFGVYAAMKAAVEGLSRGMARDLGPDGIRVNTVIPGWIMTERQITLWLTPEAEKNLMQVQCLKEKLAPADVTRMVLWLASDDSRMCTAQLWVVDAGRM